MRADLTREKAHERQRAAGDRWLLLILAAEFVNGWTDAPNAIATVVSTRVVHPHHAVVMAAVLNAAGAFAGTAVAATIGKGILRSEAIDIGGEVGLLPREREEVRARRGGRG